MTGSRGEIEFNIDPDTWPNGWDPSIGVPSEEWDPDTGAPKPKNPPTRPVNCDVCKQEIPEGELAHATTSGRIINGQFEMDEDEWFMVVCEDCGEQIQYVSGNLETALEAIDK